MAGELASRCVADARPPRASLQQHHLLHSMKTDEIEILESGGGTGGVGRGGVDGSAGIGTHHGSKVTAGWVCCIPCVWLRTSATVHKLALTTATLLVTSLLVASPVLFLLSTAPSQLPKDCNSKNDFNCLPTRSPVPECNTAACRTAAISIQSRTNWKVDPCRNFKNFSCSMSRNNLKSLRSAQEGVDALIQQLLRHNTTTGTFQKLGRLYDSCMRHQLNASSLRAHMARIGSYMPMTVTGPATISGLLLKISEYGPTPLVSIYYDLSYGRKPQSMLIIDSSMESSPVLQNEVRWLGPKAAPFDIRYDVPLQLNALIDLFLPVSLDDDKKEFERDSITAFIRELNQLRRESLRKEFTDSYVLYNVSMLTVMYPFLYWEDVIVPSNWSGPILVRSGSYLKNIEHLIAKYSTRVAHNAVILLFALGIMPENTPNAVVCTKATMWAMPEVTAAFYLAQFADRTIETVIERTESIFEVLKAHMKRAPSLKGAALVKLSQLKVQAFNWPVLRNLSEIGNRLDDVEITSDDWFRNVLNIYRTHKASPKNFDLTMNNGGQTAWAYPTIAKIFYDTLSHSIVVPLSIMLVPYFDAALPNYMHYASVGVALAKEILRSITKAFDTKLMRCVPSSVNVFSNSSRMELLLQSGGMQISYHSLLTLAGPIKGMVRMPNMNMSPQQIFYLVVAQEMCANSMYAGVNTNSDSFTDILGWLISQGGNAPNVYKCPTNSPLNTQKTCNVL